MAAAEHWGKADLAAQKTRSLLSYCTEHKDVKTIPNPYYAGRDVSGRALFSLAAETVWRWPEVWGQRCCCRSWACWVRYAHPERSADFWLPEQEG